MTFLPCNGCGRGGGRSIQVQLLRLECLISRGSDRSPSFSSLIRGQSLSVRHYTGHRGMEGINVSAILGEMDRGGRSRDTLAVITVTPSEVTWGQGGG